jgi:hypothetical protein
MQKVSNLTGFPLSEEQIKYVGLRPPTDPELQDRFISLLDWTIQEIKTKQKS